MSTAVPGQRMAQRPLRAAVAVQGALGRAANSAGVMADQMILNVGGEWKRVAFDADGIEYLEPYTLGQDEEE
jgi:hypothetical protein